MRGAVIPVRCKRLFMRCVRLHKCLISRARPLLPTFAAAIRLITWKKRPRVEWPSQRKCWISTGLPPLINWYRAGLDVERELPKLATYLGHVHVNDTYWYLEAVPELLRLATERLMENREAQP